MTSENMATALVTGGSAGIGAAIVNDMLSAGYKVISLDLAENPVKNDSLVSYQVDVSDNAKLQAIASEITAEHRVTTLVHNVGVLRESLMEDVKQDQQDAQQSMQDAQQQMQDNKKKQGSESQQNSKKKMEEIKCKIIQVQQE